MFYINLYYKLYYSVQCSRIIKCRWCNPNERLDEYFRENVSYLWLFKF